MKLFKKIIISLLLPSLIIAQAACAELGGDQNEGCGGDSLEESLAPVPKAKKQAKTLYLAPNPTSFSGSLTLGTLQGLVANLSEEQIIIKNGAYKKFLPYIEENLNCVVSDELDGGRVTLARLLEHYKPQLSGYILASSDSESQSGSVAVSLSGILGAVVVTEENRDVCDTIGLECILDVSDKDDAWLRSSEYFDKLSRDVAFEQPLSLSPKLVDLAAMSGAYFSFYAGTDKDEHTDKYSFMDKGGVVFGYNNTLGEFDTVDSLSSLELQLIPADHAFNLSTLSGFSLDRLEQKRSESDGGEVSGVHTVCIVMSDGDNMQWLNNDFITSDRWWGSDERGKFDMAWGIPPTAIDICAPAVGLLYGEMTERDEFIAQLSGLGYTFPSRWTKEGREAMAAELADYMERSDLDYLEILDDGGFKEEYLSAFTAEDAVKGLFYIDYSNYAGYGGEIIMSNGKPAVSARYRLWAGMPDGEIEYIAQAINSASCDATSADGYSFIIVHAWSGLEGESLVPDGNTMDAIAKLVESFGESVEPVTPTEFMKRISKNIAVGQ